MQRPGRICQQGKTEQGNISLKLIGFLGLSPIAVLMFFIAVMYWPASTAPAATSPASGAHQVIPSKVEKKVLGIVEGDLSKCIEISHVEDNGEVYRIDIELLSEPKSNTTVVKLTRIACEECVAIFEKYGVNKDISVRASHSETSYGATCYSQDSGTFVYEKAQ